MNITAASREKWLAAAQACPWATYFHTPYWYELYAPHQEHTALEAAFCGGVSVIVPFVKTKRLGGLFTGCYSSPGGTYGGWISESPLNKDHVHALLSVMLTNKNLVFRVNPFDPLLSGITEILKNGNGTVAIVPYRLLSGISEISKSSKNSNSVSYKFTDDFTHTLDLTCGAEEIFCKSNGSFTRGVKKAEKEGIVIKAAQSWEEWEQYYSLYRNSLNRWRNGGLKTRSIYTLDFFRRVYDNRTGHEILWLASKDGEALSGMLCFYWNKHAVYWHGAADGRYFHLRPNNLLFQRVILDAAHKGYNVFDLNPSGGYGGVETFKDRLGALRKPSPILITQTPLRSLVSSLRALPNLLAKIRR